MVLVFAEMKLILQCAETRKENVFDTLSYMLVVQTREKLCVLEHKGLKHWV